MNIEGEQKAQLEKDRRAYVDGLRKLADYIETAHDEVAQNIVWSGRVRLNVFTHNQVEYKRFGRAIGGRREKILEGSFAIQRRRFGPHQIDLNLGREQVCERVQVGTVTLPAQPAQEERTVPQYEWRCPEGYEEKS